MLTRLIKPRAAHFGLHGAIVRNNLENYLVCWLSLFTESNSYSTIFFSYNKSANNIFSYNFLDKRINNFVSVVLEVAPSSLFTTARCYYL